MQQGVPGHSRASWAEVRERLRLAHFPNREGWTLERYFDGEINRTTVCDLADDLELWVKDIPTDFRF